MTREVGRFREHFDNIRFRVKTNEEMKPETMTLEVQEPGGVMWQDLPLREDVNTDPILHNEYIAINLFLTSGLKLGIWLVRARGQDIAENWGGKDEDFKLISTYGRNYGEDYGNGL